MPASSSKRTGLALLIGMTCCGASFAGLDEGLAALAKGNYAVAAKELRPLAERGNAEAQYRVGLMHEFGRGYPVDKAQAVAWLRKAAAQDHAAAQQELGVIYATGDGVPKDDGEAVAWFRKSATLGNAAAQYNLGLMIAKGAGVRNDDADAVAWFRKAATQGFSLAQFKLGLAYEHGVGVAKDPVLAYASYAIAARDGNREHVAQRDAMAAKLSAAQARQGLTLASAWTVGQPMPASVAGAGGQPAASTTAGARARDRCSAAGQMEGEKFAAGHCAVSLYGDQHSVAIWFNEEPITPEEAENFQMSSYASGIKGGKPRTLLQILFCPGGGKPTASAAAVKSIDLNTNHAKAPLAGVQTVIEAPKDFKVEKMAGEIRPGAPLSGRIVGKHGKSAWTLDFDVTLPSTDAAAGMGCGK